ncbi:MAG: 5-(carboxyamino)imidazole ribonucleotide synthase [Bacteroidetes bacterium]|nr:5-(carboxyamino)imidazole ribonucleotide synthase [Bacteroidota bacterium]
MKKSFPLNTKIGILGGGQLGRMFIENALRYAVEIHILDPSSNAPCAHLTPHFVQGDFKDYETVYQFGKGLDVLSIEIEHVNTDALKKLEKEGIQVIPSASAIETIKDKGLQKQFYEAYEIPSSRFRLIKDKRELEEHIHFLPFFQKARRDGYDGKGVYSIASKNDFDKAFDVPSVLEKAVEIEKEISVLVAKDQKGNMEIYPVVELVFDPIYNLVDYLIAPAQITASQEERAKELAKRVCEGLQSAGLFAIEMFLSKEGEILVNETAPRAHNSGHHTIEASISSQFDNQLRILLGLPLGSSKSYKAAAMINIVGSEGYKGRAAYEGIDEVSAMENVYVHLYGKEQTKPGRKMGHVSVIGSDMEEVLEKIKKVKVSLKAIA